MYLVEQASGSKTLHQSQAESLSLFRYRLRCVRTQTRLLFRSGLEHCSLCGRVLSLAASLGLVEL